MNLSKLIEGIGLHSKWDILAMVNNHIDKIISVITPSKTRSPTFSEKFVLSLFYTTYKYYIIGNQQNHLDICI